jgi:hypothetical protein
LTYVRPGKLIAAPTANVMTAEPFTSMRICQGWPASPSAARAAFRRSRHLRSLASRPVAITNATDKAITPTAMSPPGGSTCEEVLTALDPCNEKTIARPAAMLVVYAPSRYPSIRRLGCGSSIITVTAARSDGLSVATTAVRSTTTTSLFMR